MFNNIRVLIYVLHYEKVLGYAHGFFLFSKFVLKKKRRLAPRAWPRAFIMGRLLKEEDGRGYSFGQMLVFVFAQISAPWANALERYWHSGVDFGTQ